VKNDQYFSKTERQTHNVVTSYAYKIFSCILYNHLKSCIYIAEMAVLGNVAALFDFYKNILLLFVQISGSETKDSERGQFL